MCAGALWLTEKAQRDFSLLNTTFRTHLPEPADPSHGDAILSAMFLVKDMVLYEYSRKFVENPVGWGGRLRHVENIATQPFRLASFGTNWLRKRTFAERKLPSVVLGSRDNRYELEFHAEQAPNPDSRLTLSAERDAFGMPRLKVDWRVTDLDLASLGRATSCWPPNCRAAAPAGSISIREKLVLKAQRNGIVGGHHIGTTRMSADPKDGVGRSRLPCPRRRQPLRRQRRRLPDLRPGQPDAHPARADLPAGGASWQDQSLALQAEAREFATDQCPDLSGESFSKLPGGFKSGAEAVYATASRSSSATTPLRQPD